MWISIFDRLLQGEVVEMPWSEREIGMTVRAGESDRVADSLTGDPSQFSIVTETYTLEIDGNRLTIGPVNTLFPGAVIANLNEVQATLSGASATEETPISLRIQPMEPAVDHPIRLTLLDSKAPDSTA